MGLADAVDRQTHVDAQLLELRGALVREERAVGGHAHLQLLARGRGATPRLFGVGDQGVPAEERLASEEGDLDLFVIVAEGQIEGLVGHLGGHSPVELGPGVAVPTSQIAVVREYERDVHLPSR